MHQKKRVKAEKVYKDFHKKPVSKEKKVNIELPEGIVVYLGKIVDLTYVWTFDGKLYRHEFKNARLFCDETGKTLIISPVRVTDRGIED